MDAFTYAAGVFERVYSSHPGPEPAAYRAALEAVEPIIPAVKEQLGDWLNQRPD